MVMKRRGFLASAGTVGAAGLVLPAQLLAQALPSGDDILRLADYQARVADWYFVHSTDATHQGDLRLFYVQDNGSTADLEQFTLMLHSTRGAEVMPSGYYEVAGEPFNLHIKHTVDFWDHQIYIAEFALLT